MPLGEEARRIDDRVNKVDVPSVQFLRLQIFGYMLGKRDEHEEPCLKPRSDRLGVTIRTLLGRFVVHLVELKPALSCAKPE